MTPPDRFNTATFESYRPKTPSQTAGMRAMQQAVARLKETPSLAARVRRFFGSGDAPQGLYLVGPVGTGKTHLLAAAHHALMPEVPCAFFHSSEWFRQTEPPEAFAHRLADTVDVVCLDEVEIDDPANEARLVHILKTLERRGVTLFATSNVEPEQFLSNQLGPDRFQRFLHEEFRATYRVVFVGGEDYRRNGLADRPGRGWVGPPDSARKALRDAFETAGGRTRWMPFPDLRDATTTTAHTRLMETFVALDGLFVPDVRIHDTDDALRLLRVVDDLYLEPEAPAFFFSSESPPEDWFHPDAHAGVAQTIAEKFTRTVSRLRAMCDVKAVSCADSS